MTPSRIAELRALCERATPGPWAGESTEMFEGDEPTCLYRALGPACGVEHDPDHCDEAAAQAWRDAGFIAAARMAVPELISEVERLQGAEAKAALACASLTKQDAEVSELRARAGGAEAKLAEVTRERDDLRAGIDACDGALARPAFGEIADAIEREEHRRSR